jgi:hypothetical protein
MASFTTNQIQHAIDEACSELKEWKAVIRPSVYVMSANHMMMTTF